MMWQIFICQHDKIFLVSDIMDVFFNFCVIVCSVIMAVHGSDYIRKSDNLFTLPNDIPHNTANLNLNKNRITQVSVNDLKNLTSLVELHLWQNKISVIEPGSFQNTRKLKILDLRKNRLTVISKSAFQDLTSLRELYLNTNNIYLVEDGALNMPLLEKVDICCNDLASFPDVSNLGNLRELKLNYNKIPNQPLICPMLRSLETLQVKGNKIVSIPDELFHHCDRITFVDYKANQITSVKWISSLSPTVSTILVSNNQISGNIPSTWFNDLKNLKKLNLDGNQIDSFDFTSLSYLPKLKILDLRDNQITFMEDPYVWCRGTSCSILEITATGNTLPCNSSFCWDKHFSGITLTRDDCFGKTWSAVTADDLQCEGQQKFLINLVWK